MSETPIPPGTPGSKFPDVSGSMNEPRLNVFDRDTLEYLQAQGAEGRTIARVRAAMKESAMLYNENVRLLRENADLRRELEETEVEPMVVWQIPLSYAETLVDFLHREMPGGYQFHHDQLREAIARARS